MDIETIPLVIQYCQGGNVIRGGMYDEEDADTAQAFTEGGEVVSLVRSPRGLWAIDSSDLVVLSASCHRKRFPKVSEAVDYAAARRGTPWREVDDWLSEVDSCV